jgi:hypothetical protein
MEKAIKKNIEIDMRGELSCEVKKEGNILNFKKNTNSKKRVE